MTVSYLKHTPNQNNEPDPADLSLRESADIEHLISAKLRITLHIGYNWQKSNILIQNVDSL